MRWQMLIRVLNPSQRLFVNISRSHRLGLEKPFPGEDTLFGGRPYFAAATEVAGEGERPFGGGEELSLCSARMATAP
jgi:hypothetical protein